MKKILILTLISITTCGKKSLVDCKWDLSRTKKSSDCEPKSDDERAMLALDAGDLALAQSILEPLIEKYPEEYFRYPRLAAVYADLGGFKLLDVAQATKNGGGGVGADSVDSFIPIPVGGQMDVYLAQIEWIKKAKDLLFVMPEDERQKDNGKFYGASAQLQLILYQTMYSLMQIKRFTTSVADLSQLTAADATELLSSLLKTAEVSGNVNPELADKVKGFTDKINAQEGATNQDKVSKYLDSERIKQQVPPG